MKHQYDLEGSMSDRIEFDQMIEEYAHQMLDALSLDLALQQDPDQYVRVGWESFELDLEMKNVEVDDLGEAKARFYSSFKQGVEDWKGDHVDNGQGK